MLESRVFVGSGGNDLNLKHGYAKPAPGLALCELRLEALHASPTYDSV